MFPSLPNAWPRSEKGACAPTESITLAYLALSGLANACFETWVKEDTQDASELASIREPVHATSTTTVATRQPVEIECVLEVILTAGTIPSPSRSLMDPARRDSGDGRIKGTGWGLAC